MLGEILFNAQKLHEKTSKSSSMRQARTYQHRYPRTNTTYLRTLKAVEIMRGTYTFSMNNIAYGLQISTGTVEKRLKDLYDLGFKKFHCMKNRLFRSKNSSMMRTLRRISARIQSYIDGQISLLQLFDTLGIDPP